jgi:hypothetical protein
MAVKEARTSRDGSRGSGRDDQAEQYRLAAEDALQQLDWCIGYLHGIRKTKISRVLSQNRATIRSRLRGSATAQPLPTGQTTEE